MDYTVRWQTAAVDESVTSSLEGVTPGQLVNAGRAVRFTEVRWLQVFCDRALVIQHQGIAEIQRMPAQLTLGAKAPEPDIRFHQVRRHGVCRDRRIDVPVTAAEGPQVRCAVVAGCTPGPGVFPVQR